MSESSDASGSITGLYRQWRQGHPGSLTELMTRFRPRLLALARSTLGNRTQRIADAEDALQSAMVSFWERVDSGGLEGELDRQDLWNVLGLITVRKALRQQTRERAHKRGGGRVISAGDQIPEPATPHTESSPELLCMEMLELLDEQLRPFALLKLLGHKNREIAEELDCTERKVERKLHLIRTIWGEEISNWNS